MTWGDLFAGGGGATTGAYGVDGVKVIWALNHSKMAIETHAANHPETIHYQADIRFQDEHELDPVDGIWMSSECTNFTHAKGGKKRDLGSYSLPWELIRFAKRCNPDVIIVENVREFLNWGEEIKNGKKINKGKTYKAWEQELYKLGYVNHDYKLLNSADFGAYTSRLRYFGVFTKKGIPIQFPQQKNTKKCKNEFCRWRSCKDKINLADIGKNIFDMTLCENTIKRIEAGLIKFGGDPFILKFYGSNGIPNNKSIEEPIDTIRVKDCHALVQFLMSNYSSPRPQHMCHSLENPLPTLMTSDKHAIVTQFIASSQNSNGHPEYNINSIDNPIGTMTTKQKHQLITKMQMGIYFRFISVQEAKELQGFPPDYKLLGSKADQLRHIGNSVVPLMAQLLIQNHMIGGD